MNIFSWLKKLWEQIQKWIKPTPVPDPGSINVIPVQTPFILYGPVNTWMTFSAADMEAWLKAHNTAKLDGILIEFSGFSEAGWDKKFEDLKVKFLELLPLARKYGQRIFLNLVNWGDEALKAQTDEWIKSVLTWFKDNTKPSDFVAFQMAAEWNDDQGARWCGFAETILAGFPLSWNKDSRPTTATSSYSVIDYHSANTNDIQNSDKRFFNNCDHSVTIAELSDSGVTSEKFNATKVSQWATKVIKDKKASVGLYGYGHKTYDAETIKALGKIREEISPTPTPTPDPSGNAEEVKHGLDLSKATWQGTWQGQNAKITVTAKNLGITSGSHRFSIEWSLHKWASGDGMTDGTICCAWKMNDKWYAAYLDYCPAGKTGHTFDCLKNMAESPYEPKPPKGTECGFFLLSEDKKERCNVLFSTWPL